MKWTFGNIEHYGEIKSALRRIMWERVGIIRCGESLHFAKEDLNRYITLLNFQYGRRHELELKNMLQTEVLIVEAALQRKCSIGAHYRSDFPSKSNCHYHIQWNLGSNGIPESIVAEKPQKQLNRMGGKGKK
jgi:succinate dehydrogenase/fumarate reductase flavoprotein subunit